MSHDHILITRTAYVVPAIAYIAVTLLANTLDGCPSRRHVLNAKEPLLEVLAHGPDHRSIRQRTVVRNPDWRDTVIFGFQIDRSVDWSGMPPWPVNAGINTHNTYHPCDVPALWVKLPRGGNTLHFSTPLRISAGQTLLLNLYFHDRTPQSVYAITQAGLVLVGVVNAQDVQDEAGNDGKIPDDNGEQPNESHADSPSEHLPSTWHNQAQHRGNPATVSVLLERLQLVASLPSLELAAVFALDRVRSDRLVAVLAPLVS